MNNLYDVLEVCIQDIENGADIETVLFRYPEFAEELRPILATAAKARNAAVPGPAAEVVRRNRARVLQHAAQLREAKGRPSRSFWTVSLRRALVSLAVIATLFISSTSLVQAASATIPGDNLYPVKRTWEDVRLLFTFDAAARTALQVEHENERLEELSELFAQDRSAPVDFAGVVTRQNGNLWRVAGIPVVLPPQADVRDPVAVGDAVRVRGVTQVDGSVLAERVDRLDAGVALPDVDDDIEIEQDPSGNENGSNDNNSGSGSSNDSGPEEISFEGTVNSINGDILIVDGLTMDISDAEVLGNPGVGWRAKADGFYSENGVFIVTRIEFLEAESGGDSSGLEGLDNNSNDDVANDNGNDNANDGNGNDNDNSGGGGDTNDNDNDNSGSGGGNDNDDDDGK